MLTTISLVVAAFVTPILHKNNDAGIQQIYDECERALTTRADTLRLNTVESVRASMEGYMGIPAASVGISYLDEYLGKISLAQILTDIPQRQTYARHLLMVLKTWEEVCPCTPLRT